MKLTFLGTAAAEAMPAHFCVCETCKTARKNGGKDIRKRCCYLLNDDTLIDYGPDIWDQSIMYNFDLADIKRIFSLLKSEEHLRHMYNWLMEQIYIPDEVACLAKAEEFSSNN